MRPTVYTNRPRDSYAARLLRALYSAIIPGLGQLVAGVRRRGFVLLGIFLVVSLAGVVVLTRGTDAILAWVVQPKVLLGLLGVNIIIMLVRMFAVIDAWMTARVGALKPVRPSGPRMLMTGVGLALILVLTVAPHAAAGYYTVISHNLLTSVFAGDDTTSTSLTATTIETATTALSTSTSGGSATTSSDSSSTSETTTTGESTTTTVPPFFNSDKRLTILLIGTDAGYGRFGARADSINVATVDLKTGNMAMFGIPRNTAGAPLGKKTAAALKMKTFPDILNALYPAALKHPEIAPKGGDPGAEAIRESASLILGIPIDYYAVVDMMGLVDMVNAFGGVDVNLNTALHITYAPLEAGGQKTSYVFKVGRNHLNGLQALAFARDRSDSSDYTRMGRQRCVLMGLLYQNSVTSLTLKFPKIAAAIQKNVHTNIPVSALPQLISMRSKVKTSQMISVGFTPPDYFAGLDAQGHNLVDIPAIKSAVRKVIDHPASWIAAHPAAAATTAGSGDCYKVAK